MVVLVQRAEAKDVIVIKQNFHAGIKPPIRKMHKGVGSMLSSDAVDLSTNQGLNFLSKESPRGSLASELSSQAGQLM